MFRAMESILYFKAKLRELFPPEHPDTSWLLRLAILRDDVAHERRCIAGTEGAAVDSAWRSLYAVRRVSISIGEVDAILNWYKARERLKRADLAPETAAALKAGRDAIRAAFHFLKPVRDAMGAHVNPESAIPKAKKRDPIPDVIRAVGDDVF